MKSKTILLVLLICSGNIVFAGETRIYQQLDLAAFQSHEKYDFIMAGPKIKDLKSAFGYFVSGIKFLVSSPPSVPHIRPILREEHDPEKTDIRQWALAIGTIFIVILGISILWNRRLAGEIKKRKHLERLYQENEILLNTTGEIAKVGGWELDADTMEVRWTKEIYRIHELPFDYQPPLEEAINYFHPESREELASAIKRAIDFGEPYDMELRFITETGKQLWTRTICKPHIVNGKTVKLRGIFQDITDRKETEEALRKSEENYRLLFESMEEGYLNADAQGYITRANAAIVKMCGYASPEEMIGLHMTMLYADPKERDHMIQTIATKGVLNNYEIKLKTRDGHHFWTSCNINMNRNENGEFTGTDGLIRDITERKQAEEALYRIEWLLSKNIDESIDDNNNSYQPPYGDVTELNTCRLILDSVGKDTLKRLTEDSIDLLETSVAVYEKNGDYAFGMFSSGWCRLLDNASRNLCGTDDNREALNCGKWLCHENCWNDSAKIAIQTGKPTDIECIGAVHLYAVPIFAGNEVIGAINIGYGDPPTDEPTLQKLAQRFNISVEELRKCAEPYESRPQYIVGLAKKKLHTTAALLGEIVERRRAEFSARKQARLLDLIFAHSLDSIVLLDSEYNFIRVSEAYAESCRRHVSEFPGRNHFELYPSDFKDEFENIAKEKKIYQRYARPFVFPDHPEWGMTYWDIGVVPIMNDKGEIDLFLFTLKDVTDNIRAQAKIKEYSEHLEQMVEERTAELKKVHGLLLARERLAVLGHFAGSVAHEIRNPLAVIGGAAYFLKLKLADADELVKQHLEFITTNVGKSDVIIESLLNLSQMKKPTAESHDILDMFQASIQTSHIPNTVTVETDFDVHKIFVPADFEQLRMAFKNIIKNAVQAMDESGRLLVSIHEVGAGHGDRPHSEVEIVIADTGPGIKPEHLESVFEPLFSTKINGIGFGLSITRMIIENHGGTIRAESEPGTGARFIVTLPQSQ